MKVKTKLVLAVSAVALTAFAITAVVRRSKPNEILFETVKISKGEIKNAITATGTIEPVDKVEVGTQVSGVILKIHVDYNSTVKKGQLLAELDRTTLKSTVDQNRATLQAALTDRNYKEKNLTRMKTLLEKDMISQEAFDKINYEYEVSKVSVIRAQAELERSKNNLSYATIYSPIDGVILSRAVDEGQTVAASLNAPTLFTIAKDLTHMQLQVDVDEADIGQVKQGQRATFTVDAFTGEEFGGKVKQVRLESKVSSNVVTYTVIVEAGNPELKLMPGMTATVSIVTKEITDINVLPLKALSFRPDQKMLMELRKLNGEDTPQKQSIEQKNRLPQSAQSRRGKANDRQMVWVKDGKTIRPLRIKTGARDNSFVEVVEGLSGDEEIVVAMTDSKAQKGVSGQTTQGTNPFMPQSGPRGMRRLR